LGTSGTLGTLKPVPPNLDKSSSRIAGMFDAIAGRYDLLNTILSAGRDRHWRRSALASLALTGRERVLDVCTGTADVAITAARARTGAAEVLGVDFAPAMLARGLEKVRRQGLQSRVRLVRGDAMALPVASASVDAVTMAFGIRNVHQPDAACAELFRVVRPGGRIAILEFGLPVVPAIRPAYRWYLRHVLPRIGRAVSGHAAAYSYLPESVGTFEWGESFAQRLEGAGFYKVRSQPLTFGIVYLYSAAKP
jgi:demethylmenaquinone methyltransferase/2-methoxy-6-polyprenyl-1,4-benzoquinol methylase